MDSMVHGAQRVTPFNHPQEATSDVAIVRRQRRQIPDASAPWAWAQGTAKPVATCFAGALLGPVADHLEVSINGGTSK